MAIAGTLQKDGQPLYPRTLASQIAGLTAFLDEWYATKQGSSPGPAEPETTYGEAETMITSFFGNEEIVTMTNVTVGGDATVGTLTNNPSGGD